MRSMLVLTLTIVLPFSSFAQTKRPMTIDDLITAIRVSEPRISPDGKQVAFVSDVYPQCKDEECNIRTRAALEKDPVKVRLLTGLPFRHWDEWRTNIRHHVFVADLDTGEARDVTLGDYDSPPHFY